MSVFFTSSADVRFPDAYSDVAQYLLVRVVDPSVTTVPDFVHTSELGDDLQAAFSWNLAVVPKSALRLWGVSGDEILATASTTLPSFLTSTSNRSSGKGQRFR